MDERDNLSLLYDDSDEILLADIALKIQLSQTEYEEAVAHYAVIEDHLNRDGSPLKGLVKRIYAQGSMAINSTISSASDREEFDIDLIVELDLPADADPKEVLELLHKSIKGEPGSRYYRNTKLKSRCVTIQYKNMHMDICPAVLQAIGSPRTSTMFHWDKDSGEKYRRTTNPWGFAEWIKKESPPEEDYSKFFQGRGIILLKAETEPVPDPIPVYQKSRKIVAHQLIKRFRNNLTGRPDGSKPPSVILARLAVSAGFVPGGLLAELENQARYLEAELREGMIHVTNPAHEPEILTDRWPGEIATQSRFYKDIRTFQSRLIELRNAKDPPSKYEILRDLFGERPTLSAFETFQRKYDERLSDGTLMVNKETASIAIAASGMGGDPIASERAQAAPRHFSHAGKVKNWKS